MAVFLPTITEAATLEELLVEKGVISKGEAATAQASEAPKIYWKKGTKIDFPDNGFTFGISTLLQSRYTFTDNDEDSGKGNSSSFVVKRARIIAAGTALNEEFSYKLEGDLVGGKSSDGAVANLKDGYVEWKAFDWAAIRLGQFKTNLGRQHLSSDSTLQFADRSMVSDYFTLDRQNGGMVTSKLSGDQLVMTAGIFNGESDGESGPNKSGVDTNHTGIVSLRWNPIGKMNAFEEGDIDWTEEMALSFGASYGYLDSRNAVAADLVEGFAQNLIAVDANMKYLGWSLHGELFNNTIEADDLDFDAEPMGFYVQAGYFFDPKTIEVAGRYAYLDCDSGAAPGDCSGNDDIDEVSVGLNYYWWKHHLKAQLNYVRLSESGVDGGDSTSNRWLVQVSSSF